MFQCSGSGCSQANRTFRVQTVYNSVDLAKVSASSGPCLTRRLTKDTTDGESDCVGDGNWEQGKQAL